VSDNLPAEKDIFHSNVIANYENSRCRDKYVSIYFRTLDFDVGEKMYRHFQSKIEEVIQANSVVFVCSNSYEFKSVLKEKNYKNVFFNDIYKENIHGNHWGTPLTINREESVLKTIQTIGDMLFLKDSSCIYHFSEWSRTSNFLFLSELRNTSISSLYFSR